MKLYGNTVLVTGATSGIGLGLAKRLHLAGNTVIIGGRRRHLLEDIRAEYPGLYAVELDVTNHESIQRCFDHTAANFPEFNVLINNAGVMRPEMLTDPGHLTTAEATIQTNLMGPLRMVNKFLPLLENATDAVIMNVTSGRAFVPLPATPTYSATKAALHSYTESLRAQLSPFNIEVLELVPPRVQTDLMGQRHNPEAMPLPAYLDEVFKIMRDQPGNPEICVDRVKVLRYAEATGRYQDVFTRLGTADRSD